ncbi:hypothetical protein DRF65_20475 [Chryseobacterium pennae]|uniref:Uncharacterized protein n=1 Tax=Chryseobacterium pennae TaxID=2258962 RepID=A0A3D9C4N7_9FLAO|nr:hypothetical protein [Chryseobacterium pennae]REC60441.1 hypothetical protein DRF65_20475 [Chryseobacterium pennae]
MGKVFIVTGILYLLYYAGNIVYDLFIKTAVIVRNENEGELISLGSITEDMPADIVNVSEQETENLNMPGSYTFSDDEALFAENDDESGIHQARYEEEKMIDNYNEEPEPTTEEKNNQTSFLSRISSGLSLKEEDVLSKETEVLPSVISDEVFRNFLEKASHHIVVSSESGQNFYKSSLVF